MSNNNKRKVDDTDLKDDSGREQKIQRGEEELKVIHSSVNGTVQRSDGSVTTALIEEMLVPGRFVGSNQSKYMDIRMLMRSIGPFLPVADQEPLFSLSKQTNRQIISLNLSSTGQQENWQYQGWFLSPFGVDIRESANNSEQTLRLIHQFQHGLPIYYARNVVLYEQSPFQYNNGRPPRWLIEQHSVLFSMHRLKILELNFANERIEINPAEQVPDPMIKAHRHEFFRRLRFDVFLPLNTSSKYNELRLMNVPTPGLIIGFENQLIPLVSHVNTLYIGLQHEDPSAAVPAESSDEEEEEEEEDDDATIPYRDNNDNDVRPVLDPNNLPPPRSEDPTMQLSQLLYNPDNVNLETVRFNDQGIPYIDNHSPDYAPISPEEEERLIEIDTDMKQIVPDTILDAAIEEEAKLEITQPRFDAIQYSFTVAAERNGTIPIDAHTLYRISNPAQGNRIFVTQQDYERINNVFFNVPIEQFHTWMFYKPGTTQQVQTQIFTRKAYYTQDPSIPLIVVTLDDLNIIMRVLNDTLPAYANYSINTPGIYRVKTEEEEQKERDNAHLYHYDISTQQRHIVDSTYWKQITTLSLLLGYDNQADWAIAIDRLLSGMPNLTHLTIVQCADDWIANNTFSYLSGIITDGDIPPFLHLQHVSIKSNIGLYTIAEVLTHTRVLRYTADENKRDDGGLLNDVAVAVAGGEFEREPLTIMPNLHTLQLTWRMAFQTLREYVQFFTFICTRYFPQIREVYVCLIHHQPETFTRETYNATVTLPGHEQPTSFYMFTIDSEDIDNDSGFDSGELSVENDNGTHNDGLRFEHKLWPTRPGKPLRSGIDEEQNLVIPTLPVYAPDAYKPVTANELFELDKKIIFNTTNNLSDLPLYLQTVAFFSHIRAVLNKIQATVIQLISKVNTEPIVLQLNRLDRVYSKWKIKKLLRMNIMCVIHLNDLKYVIDKLHLDQYQSSYKNNKMHSKDNSRLNRLNIMELKEHERDYTDFKYTPDGLAITQEQVRIEYERLVTVVVKGVLPSIKIVEHRMRLFPDADERQTIFTALTNLPDTNLTITRQRIQHWTLQIEQARARLLSVVKDETRLNELRFTIRTYQYLKALFVEQYYKLKVEGLLYDDDDTKEDTEDDRVVQSYLSMTLFIHRLGGDVENLMNQVSRITLNPDKSTEVAQYRKLYDMMMIFHSILTGSTTATHTNERMHILNRSMPYDLLPTDALINTYFSPVEHYTHYISDSTLQLTSSQDLTIQEYQLLEYLRKYYIASSDKKDQLDPTLKAFYYHTEHRDPTTEVVAKLFELLESSDRQLFDLMNETFDVMLEYYKQNNRPS